ncbi:MAG: cobalamin-binding protein, partial [Archangium sp.]|nr:cobalamin-binding protein [Archangium sp.]
PTDRELLATVEACRAHPNLTLEVCGIAGLPFTSEKARSQECALVEKLRGLGCDVGSQRLEAQPGALVTQHPERFDMETDARTFDEFVAWFAERGHVTNGEYPMVRFRDPAVEDAVQRAADAVNELARPAVGAETALDVNVPMVSSVASTMETHLGAWLGSHAVPPKLAKTPVTVVRSARGEGVACAPTLTPPRFSDPNVQAGESGAAILAALAAFERPTAPGVAMKHLRTTARLDLESAHELVEHLAATHLVRRA